MRKPTLNLGCGPDPWGDVRLDVQSWDGNANIVMDFDSVPLPFPDKYFPECLINHVLEHSKDPQRLLRETIRVSDLVHAKYPFKYDRIPFVLMGLATFSSTCLSSFKGAGERIHPKGLGAKNYYQVRVEPSFVTFFGCGRKARFLRWIPPIRIVPYEWVVQSLAS